MLDYCIEMHRILNYQAHILEDYNENNEPHIKINFKPQCSQKKMFPFQTTGGIFKALSYGTYFITVPLVPPAVVSMTLVVKLTRRSS